MKVMKSLLLILTIAVLQFGVTHTSAQNPEAKGDENSKDNPVFYVLLHAPGPQWKDGIPFRQQPGIEEHVRYMAGLLEQGLILMGGPFLDDSGGMMISRIATLEEARRVANEDPAVKAGTLTVTVRPWMVPMTSIEMPAVHEAKPN